MGRKTTPQKSPPIASRRTAPPRRSRWVLLGAVLVCVVGIGVWASGRDGPPQVYIAQVVNEYPHDADAYSQGLIFVDGALYEGTGKYGRSTLRRVDLKTGQVQQQVRHGDRVFGEGITAWDDTIVQLTWKSNVGMVYDRKTFELRQKFRYSGEGWGITQDGRNLIVSDGTSTLRFLDPKSFRVVRRLSVRSGGNRISRLNELEFVNGEILANVWYKDYIVRISPRSGEVTGYFDLSRLWPQNQRPDKEAVLNGIAYDEAGKRLFVTGKNWPRLYEIRLLPRR
ncbi:MAG: glutaminyl-peptide cyclotransferase [Pirellulaceae bacterium]|nr:glutaminyl-peptide cyclotransferase [Pirellulaceae bacterium]